MTIDDRRCDICGQHVPERDGLYAAYYRLFLHCEGSPCYSLYRSLVKDFSRSKRGRNRSRSEFRKVLAETKQRAARFGF